MNNPYHPRNAGSASQIRWASNQRVFSVLLKEGTFSKGKASPGERVVGVLT